MRSPYSRHFCSTRCIYFPVQRSSVSGEDVCQSGRSVSRLSAALDVGDWHVLERRRLKSPRVLAPMAVTVLPTTVQIFFFFLHMVSTSSPLICRFYFSPSSKQFQSVLYDAIRCLLYDLKELSTSPRKHSHPAKRGECARRSGYY